MSLKGSFMSSNIKDKLEIILITYNRVEKLKSTLDSILADDSPIKDFDIKILNNRSTDGTTELINEYQVKFPNLQHIIHNINIGGNGNIARAYEYASKEYVWEICDDDFYDWKSWHEVEYAINDGYDLILTRIVPKTIADIYYEATFVPCSIYKTENITSTAIINSLDNIHNFFPHLAFVAKIINENKRVFHCSSNIVDMGIINFNPGSYIRGCQSDEIPKDRRDMFWTVGYLSSIQLISDRKKQIEIIDGLRHGYDSLYSLFFWKIYTNYVYYNDSYNNLFKMFRNLSFKQRIMFILAFIQNYLKFWLNSTRFLQIEGPEKWISYFKFSRQQKYINKLGKKLKNKKVVIYGAGTISEVLCQNYDLSPLNIIAFSDKKFKEKEKYKNYDAIPPSEINSMQPDIILSALYRQKNIEIAKNEYGIKTKTIPLIQRFPFILV